MGLYLIAKTAWYLSTSWWFGIIMAVLGLGFVIFVHELGHFLVAKACGVKCEKFYVGFDIPIKLGWGKWGIPLPASLWKKQWGETVYGIGIVPLGGYVKMLGQDDNPAKYREMQEKARLAKEQGDSAAADSAAEGADDAPAGGDSPGTTAAEDEFVLDPRSYMAKSVPRRMAIISAGVIMNLIFAVNFAALAYYLGVPYTETIIGNTIPGSPASAANLPLGGKIIQVTRDGRRDEQLRFGMDLNQIVALWDKGEKIDLLIRHPDGQEVWHELVPQVITIEGEGDISRIGIAPLNSLQLSAEDPVLEDVPAPAAKASTPFQGSDKIVALKINGQEFKTDGSIEFRKLMAQHVDDVVTFIVERIVPNKNNSKAAPNEKPATERVEIEVGPRQRRVVDVQLTTGPIVSVQEGSPGEKAKLQKGDVIRQVNGQDVVDPLTLPDVLRRLAGTEVTLQVLRGGKPIELKVTPEPPTRFFVGPSFDQPIGIESLGVAFAIEDKVAAATSASQLKPGDVVVAAWFSGDSEKTQELLEESGMNKEIDLTKKKYNWLSIDELLQTTPADTKLHVKRKRGDETVEVVLTPQLSTDWHLPTRGIRLQRAEKIRTASSIGEAYALGLRQTKEDAFRVFTFLRKLVTGRVSPKMLGGPFTILDVAATEASRDFSRLLMFLTLLSANLAVINFLPIPVLDGGHMVFLTLEAIFRRPVSERIVIPLTYLGLILILGLMIFVFGRDISRYLL